MLLTVLHLEIQHWLVGKIWVAGKDGRGVGAQEGDLPGGVQIRWYRG